MQDEQTVSLEQVRQVGGQVTQIELIGIYPTGHTTQ